MEPTVVKTVFVSGCFDILHGGHIEFLTQARALGDRLVVCVPTDEVIKRHKERRPALPLDHRIEVLKALSVVDEVVIGDDAELGLNFKTRFKEIHPALLAVTEDDRYEEAKRSLCAEIGAEYVKLPKTLEYERVSSTGLRNYIKAPEYVPLRVDFGGGWLDVPKFAREGAYIVNCAITPMVSLHEWPYKIGGGLGGSAAYKLLLGENCLKSELGLGVGWQDPAAIIETGLCVWRSGEHPVLEFKSSGDWLKGRMALLWTGHPHNTPSLIGKHNRDFGIIRDAGLLCYEAVKIKSRALLATGMLHSNLAQVNEGMDFLSHQDGAIGAKYCGGGFGGYALYLFSESSVRDSFVAENNDAIAIEPYCKPITGA